MHKNYFFSLLFLQLLLATVIYSSENKSNYNNREFQESLHRIFGSNICKVRNILPKIENFCSLKSSKKENGKDHHPNAAISGKKN